MSANEIAALVVLFVCLALIALVSIRDCESDPDYFARESKKRDRAFRRDLDKMRRRW